MLLLFILSACSIQASEISKIEIVNPTNGEKTVIDKNSETFKTLIEALNKKDKIKKDLSDLFAFELFLDKGNQTDAYIMKFDIDNKNVYLIKDDMVYSLKSDISKRLLEDDSFSYAYINKTINKAYLYHNGEVKDLNIQYDWVYSDINGKVKQKSGTVSEKNEKLTIKNGDDLNLKFDLNPDNQITRVYFGGNAVYTGKSLYDAINYIKSDGEYYIESELNWNKKNDSKSYGSQKVSFTAEIDNPADFNIITKENYQGNILIVKVENLNKDETVKINTKAVKIETDAYPIGTDGFSYAEIMPIDLDIKSGDYEITATFNEGKNNEYKKTKTLNIINKAFKTQYLTVSEDLNSNNNDDKSIIEFAEVVKPARTVSVPMKLWEGEFIMPVEGELTTDFAETRYVNDDPSPSRHSGIDLAAPVGTEVKAPNNGKVVLVANNLLSTGNTLVIDHGMGLFTSYYHLNSINVKKGDDVKKGDVIAAVGTTGFSTGPHLHYAISIFNSYVNTYQPMGGIIE